MIEGMYSDAIGAGGISDRKKAKIAKVYKRGRIPKGILITKDGKPTRPGKAARKTTVKVRGQKKK